VGLRLVGKDRGEKDHTTINNDLGLADDGPTQEMFGFLSGVLKK
jgi:hypothetical protein